jgi:hypothetical protein
LFKLFKSSLVLEISIPLLQFDESRAHKVTHSLSYRSLGKLRYAATKLNASFSPLYTSHILPIQWAIEARHELHAIIKNSTNSIVKQEDLAVMGVNNIGRSS